MVVILVFCKMNRDNQIWRIKDLFDNKDKIDPKPQYQRTSVWSNQKKKLLIDSILRGYDLPKFYVTETANNPHFSYEVTDGQQRMRAIWEFMSEDTKINYALGQGLIDGVDLSGFYYKKLPKVFKKKIKEFELHISIIKDSTQEEVRSLFARLQMGEKLNPVELRHAISSNIGNLIFALTENHSFFQTSGILNTRYKHQDYLDHVMSLIYYKEDRNLKAIDLKKFYIDLANVKITDFQPILRKTSTILDYMERVNKFKKGIFKNKWGFVDTFLLFYQHSDKIQDVYPKNFANNFHLFEIERKKNNKIPENLIEDKGDLKYDKDLYDYIIAFNSGGALKQNIKIRHRVFVNKFLNSENFKILK